MNPTSASPLSSGGSMTLSQSPLPMSQRLANYERALTAEWQAGRLSYSELEAARATLRRLLRESKQ